MSTRTTSPEALAAAAADAAEMRAHEAAYKAVEIALGPERYCAYWDRRIERNDRLRALAAVGASPDLVVSEDLTTEAVGNYMIRAFGPIGEAMESAYFALQQTDPARFQALSEAWEWVTTRCPRTGRSELESPGHPIRAAGDVIPAMLGREAGRGIAGDGADSAPPSEPAAAVPDEAETPEPALSLEARIRAGERPLAAIRALSTVERELLWAKLGFIVKTEPACGDPCFPAKGSPQWRKEF